MHLAIIVAAAENGLIGRNNALPWHLPGDLQYFKRVTMGKPILMGRKTFESIGRPLPGRTNVVITRNPDFSAEGIRVVESLAAALRLAEDIALVDGVEELVVIGGAEIYREALPLAQRLYLTEVHASIEGDAWLPEIDWADWREVQRERHAAEGNNPYDYSFVVYERRAK
ncbi:MAG: dihydrofolate reductase [Haliea sp.]|jgi:dihydrofolate reductase|nr:dihydrofolate reductase [Haliea sp.]